VGKQLSIQQLTASAESALGWTYVSPGSNDCNGIDCSGLFVKMYRDQGAQIYHGSNTIFHEYCKLTDKLEGIGQLEPGMAVFKVKPWTSDDSDNRWYGQEPGNVSHIGYVASVNPLRIIHASSAAGCVTTDDSIGKWKYWGELSAVEYSGEPEPSPEPGPDPDPEPVPVAQKIVWAKNGKDVNLRVKPTASAALVDQVPVGDSVDVIESAEGWAHVKWRKKIGYMMESFLYDELPDDPTPSEDRPTLRKGDRGPYVQLAQTKLIQRGYYCGTKGADAIFGTGTEEAVRQFQMEHGQAADGIIGPKTWEALDASERQLYTVTIPGLPYYHAEALVKNYQGASMREE